MCVIDKLHYYCDIFFLLSFYNFVTFVFFRLLLWVVIVVLLIDDNIFSEKLYFDLLSFLCDIIIIENVKMHMQMLIS